MAKIVQIPVRIKSVVSLICSIKAGFHMSPTKLRSLRSLQKKLNNPHDYQFPYELKSFSAMIVVATITTTATVAVIA